MVHDGFVARLKAARGTAGMTQVAAGIAIGVHPVTYAKWETAKMQPTVEHVRKAAEVFRVHLLWLVNGSGPRKLRRTADGSLPEEELEASA